jgi:hypothetical protein
MQEVFETLAVLIIEKDTYICGVLDQVSASKRNKQIQKLRSSDAESIFQAIEQDNPFTIENKQETID